MAKKKQGEKGMVIFISKDFNLKLKQHMLNLEKIGVHKTKAELIPLLAEVGLMFEQKEIEITKT